MAQFESPFLSFETIFEAVLKTDLANLLPKPLCKTVVEFRGGVGMSWDMVGDDVEISNDDLTIRQIKPSRSALANVTFKPNTGIYSWKISVDCIMQGGCKYIGVVNSIDINKYHLNSNLQSGCSDRRIAWVKLFCLIIISTKPKLLSSNRMEAADRYITTLMVDGDQQELA